MPNKTVTIGVNDNPDLKMTFRNVTEFKASEEIESDVVKTFDGPIVRGGGEPAYTIDISKLDLATMDDYVKMRNIVTALRNSPGTITVSEIVQPKGEGDFKVTSHYNNCLLSSNEYTIDVEDLTARDLSFSAESCNDEDPVRV